MSTGFNTLKFLTAPLFFVLLVFQPLMAGSLQGVPKYIPEGLPHIEEMDESLALALKIPVEKVHEAADTLRAMKFYQDSVNTDKYYVLATFKAVSDEPAASVIVNTRRLDHIDKIYEVDEEFFGSEIGELTALRVGLVKLTKKLAKVQEKGKRLSEAEIDYHQKLKAELRKQIDDVALSRKDITSALTNIEKEVYYKRMVRYYGRVGVPISRELLEKQDNATTNALSKRNAALELGNTGNFTLNAQAKISSGETTAIRIYAYMRKLRKLSRVTFSMLPLKRIQWESLAELGSDAKVVGIPIYRNLKGGGNLAGVTLNADLTAGGASAFGMFPSPVILPIVPKAYVPMKVPPFTATIICNFEQWTKARLRSDKISMGWLYNGDLCQDFFDKSDGNYECNVKFVGGSGDKALKELREVAVQKAVNLLKDRLQTTFFNRVNASQQELTRLKRAHQLSVSSSHNVAFGGYGWHTTRQNMESFAKMKIKETITYDTNEPILIDLPTSICVAYDKKEEAYYSCNIKERKKAKPLNEATRKLYEGCKEDDMSSKECRKEREKTAEVDEDTGRVMDDFGDDEVSLDTGGDLDLNF
ncbi:MAG: hypothetical protein DRR08_28635 [Candidatus Parabeggiatoa sp. nov. 2]|nr:MAG: hypothetical protein DRR08_28635 [Gammaproteobacteria bacterium]